MNKLNNCCNKHSDLCGVAGVNNTTFYCCDKCNKKITAYTPANWHIPESKDNYKELKEKFEKMLESKTAYDRYTENGWYYNAEYDVNDEVEAIWSFIEHSLLTQKKDIIKEIEGKKLKLKFT